MHVRRVYLGLVLLLFPSLAPAMAATVERVSVGSDGAQANDWCSLPCISADGRYVAFASWASNLVSGDSNGYADVFVHDRLTAETTRVSVASDGAEANDDSLAPAISADGRYVAFYSYASTLVPGDTNGEPDIFVHDRETGETARVSVASDGAQAGDGSVSPSISADGRYVVFTSWAADLVPEDWNASGDVFIHDRTTGETRLLSVSTAGAQGGDQSDTSSISPDARCVAFRSRAPALVADDTNAEPDIFVRDRDAGQTTRVSVSSNGTEADSWNARPCISAEGRYVAFTSYARNLVPDNDDLGSDVFVHDRENGETSLVSAASDGTPGAGWSDFPAISADGRYVAFFSTAADLVCDDTNDVSDVFVHDRATGVTTRMSVATDGTQADDECETPGISADGRYVVLRSLASTLTPADTNGVADIFVRDRLIFDDVPLDHWAFSAVEYCWMTGLVSGYPDGLYRPAVAVARDQMAVYLSRAVAGSDEQVGPGPETPTFPDVPADHWAYRHIEYAVAGGIVQGYGDGSYQPDWPVSRGQMAVYIARARGWVAVGDNMTTAPDLFPDVLAGFWAGTAVEACVANGVVAGYAEGYYRPAWPVTRDQMAVYVSRAFARPT